LFVFRLKYPFFHPSFLFSQNRLSTFHSLCLNAKFIWRIISANYFSRLSTLPISFDFLWLSNFSIPKFPFLFFSVSCINFCFIYLFSVAFPFRCSRYFLNIPMDFSFRDYTRFFEAHPAILDGDTSFSWFPSLFGVPLSHPSETSSLSTLRFCVVRRPTDRAASVEGIAAFYAAPAFHGVGSVEFYPVLVGCRPHGWVPLLPPFTLGCLSILRWSDVH
jgi:hypothetical protein